MRRLGVHTSIAGGLPLSLERVHALGCTTLQIFSHNPRGWAVKAIPEEDVFRFKTLRAEFDLSPVVIHTSYLINLASRDVVLLKKSLDLLVTEMDRADTIGADYVILHTGSASGDDERMARQRAIAALNSIADKKQWNAGLLIENTAGERGDISSAMPDLSEILSGVRGRLIAGVCIDTCHAFAAGYALNSGRGIQRMADEVDEMERSVGAGTVKLIHLNDSKGDSGSHIDRHEHIGFGRIGAKALQRFINCGPFRHAPLILETPKKKESDDPANLAKVRRMMRMKR
jgi:deoxyribonuclease IV